jgi:hypothetical protein
MKPRERFVPSGAEKMGGAKAFPLIDSMSQMDYTIKLNCYYHRKFLIIGKLEEGRGHKQEATSGYVCA